MRLFVKVCMVMALVLGLGLMGFAQTADQTPYQSWAKFKVGASVKYQQSADMAGMKTESEVVYTLLELTPEKAVVEMSGATMVGGNKMEMPKTKMEYQAKVPTEQASAAAAAAPKAEVKQGEEEVEAGGGKFKCKTIETTVNQGDAAMSTKIWASEEVPGGLVKSVTTMEKPVKSTTTIILVEKK